MNLYSFIRSGIIVVVISFSLFCKVGAQEISLVFQTTDTLNRSDKDLFINDINGDTCSLAIIKTRLKDIKFYTNQSVERIVTTEEEYRVWISNGSSLLKLAIPDLPMIEYKLEIYGKRPVLYLFILNASTDSLRTVIKYNDTKNPVYSINTNPGNATVFINDILIGKTPALVPVSIPGDIFDYKITKTGYVSAKGSDSTRTSDYILSLDLVQRSKVKMYFIEFLTGQTWFNTTVELADNSHRGNVSHWINGIMFGKTGGSGWYSSAKIGFIKWTYEGVLDSPQFNDLRISAGLTQSLTRYFQAYGKIGIGYVLSKDSYYDYNTYEQVIYNFNGVGIDLGIIFKIGSRILFSAQATFPYGKIRDQAYIDYTDANKYGFIGGDYSFGLGYAFNYKKSILKH
jgi:hypothetical protein